MKNPAAILLNIVYWFLYLIFFSLFYNSMNYPAVVFFPIIPDREIFTLTGALVIIPSVFAFYAGYTVLFDSLLVKRRYLQFITASVTVLVLSYGIMFLLSGIQVPFNPKLNFAADNPAFLLHYGTNLLFLALVNCFTGIVTKGFVTWLKSRPSAEIFTNNSIA